MSELTRCNFCNLLVMRHRAKERGIDVLVRAGEGEWVGWTLAIYTDQDEPSAYFLELTEECVC